MAGSDSSWAQARPVDVLSRAVGDTADMSGFMFQSATSSAVDNEMRFATERSLRTSFIVLASINAFAAAATAVGIFFDCYLQARRRDSGFRLRSSLLTIIGPKETFPYIVSLGIAVQGTIFAVAQSPGLEAIQILGCTQTSQMVLPALFIVPYIQLVFGLETTIRALTPQPFRRSPRWALPVCLGVVLGALIATYVVTRVKLAPNFCFAELLWFVQRWALASFALLTVIAAMMLIGSLIIYTRLHKFSGVSGAQRTSASWTACYMVLALATTVTMLPFFWSLYADDMGQVMRYQVRLSMAATIVVNLTGFLTGGLYVLLRCAKSGKFGRAGYFEFDTRTSVSSDRSSPGISIYTKQVEQPISPVLLEQMRRDLDVDEQMRSEKMSAWPTAVSATATKSARSQRPDISVPIPHIMSPEMAFSGGSPATAAGLREDASYSLFPPRRGPPGTKQSLPLPSTGRYPDALMAHQLLPPGAAWMGGHDRKSSLGSSATVPIALRLSNINEMPSHTSSYQEVVDSGQSDYRGLAITTDVSTDEPSGEYASIYVDDDLFDFGDAVAQQRLSPTVAEEAPSEDEVTLSPTVYSPAESSADKTRKASAKQWI